MVLYLRLKTRVVLHLVDICILFYVIYLSFPYILVLFENGVQLLLLSLFQYYTLILFKQENVTNLDGIKT